MKEFIVSVNEENKTLYKLLKVILPKAPDSFIYKMLRKKNIKLNDSKASGNEKLVIGDVIRLYLSDETFNSFSGVSINERVSEYEKAYKSLKGVKVVFENEDIIVLFKPSNVLSQKASSKDLSLNEWMIGYLIGRKEISENSLNTFRPSILNRLDRNTKGLVIGAKNLKAGQVVSKLIKDRDVKKIYEATVVGKIEKEIVLEGYISKDTNNNRVRIYKNRPTDIKTSYIKTIINPIKISDDFTTIEVDLVTGKSHQIRAHLASINHPILGDPKYGNNSINKRMGINEQQLTAKRIEFPKDCEINSINGLVISI